MSCVTPWRTAIWSLLRQALAAELEQAQHPLLLRLAAEADSKRFAALSEIVLDHALLADGSQLENPADYVQRMNKLLLELDSSAGTS